MLVDGEEQTDWLAVKKDNEQLLKFHSKCRAMEKDEEIFHLIFPRHDADDDGNMMGNSPVNDKWIISPSSLRHDFDEFFIDLFLLMPYELCKQQFLCFDLHAEERSGQKHSQWVTH